MFLISDTMTICLAVFGAAVWEVFVGWSFWTSVKSDFGTDVGQPVSGGEAASIPRYSPAGPVPHAGRERASASAA